MPFKEVQKKIGKGHAYLITSPSNIRYLSGFTGSNGQILMIRNKSYLLTDFRYFGLAEKVLPKGPKGIELSKVIKSPFENLNLLAKKHKIKTIYFEPGDLSYEKFLIYKKNLKKISFKPKANLIEEFRIVKSREERVKLIKAQRIAEKILLEVRRKLKRGQKEKELAWEIIRLAHKFGADDVSFPPIVAFGKNSGTPHHLSGDTKLKKGDMVLLDMGVIYKGYCSDMTRTFFTAPPTPLQKKVYLTVLEAQQKAIESIKAGITGIKADGIARKIITDAGYGPEFGHSLGHGVGLQIHELPSLSNHYRKPIPEYTVVTVEPGIYLQNSFGVRIEDMVLVTRKKALNLTKIPKKFEDCIVSIK